MRARADEFAKRLGAGDWRALLELALAATAIGVLAGVAGLFPAAFVLGLAPLAYFACRSLAAGSVLIVLSSPLVSLGTVDVGFHLLPCYVFVAAALAGAIARGELRRLEVRVWDRLLLAFLLVAAVVSIANIGTVPRTTVVGAVGANGPQLRTLAQLAAIALMAALYLVLRTYLSSPGRFEVLVRAQIVATGFVALYAIYQVIGQQIDLPYTYVNTRREVSSLPPADTYLRPNSTLTEASPLAQYMLTSLFLGLAWLRSPPSRPAWMSTRGARLLTLVAGFTVAASLSVAAWVSSALWAPLVIALARRERRRRFLVATASALVLALLVVLPAVRGGGGSIRDVIDSQSYVRQSYWIAGVRTAADHPFGVGVGNFPFYYPLDAPLSTDYEYTTSLTDAHNVFLDVAAETGIVGFLLWSGFFITLIVAALRHAIAAGRARVSASLPNIGVALSLSLAAGLTMHLTYSYAYYPFEWVLAGMVGSLPVVLRRRHATARAATAPSSDRRSTYAS
jgi:hypothetical protein